jgi:hypothetical protein
MIGTNRDLLLGIVMLAVAAGYFLLCTRIPESALADAVGPTGLPTIYAAVLALLSVMLIGSGIRDRGFWIRKTLATDLNSRSETADPGSRIPNPGSLIPDPRWHRVAVLLLIGAAYVAVVPWSGYLVSIGVLIAATTWHESGVFDRRVALIAVGGAALFWVLFVLALGIPQPPGIWSSLF